MVCEEKEHLGQNSAWYLLARAGIYSYLHSSGESQAGLANTPYAMHTSGYMLR